MVFFIEYWIDLKLLYGFLWLFVCCSVLFVFLPSSLFPFVFLVLLFCALQPAFFLGRALVGCFRCMRVLFACRFVVLFLFYCFPCFAL